MAGFFLNREGDLSIFRIGILIAIVGGVLIVGGFVLASAEQASYRAPLDIEPPPDTVQLFEEDLSPVTRRLYFESLMSPEDVSRYYDAELAELQGLPLGDLNRDRCIRSPRDGNYQTFVPGNGSVPYEFQCIFQQVSLLGVDRSTFVRIHPGVRNDEDGTNYEGTTRIYYDQLWQP